MRENPLAAALSGSEDDSAPRLRSAVRAALDRLPPRQREIVERCDLGAERHAEVVCALAVSERHFYRERSKALGAMRTHLLACAAAAGAGPAAACVVSAFDVALDHAAALAQTGNDGPAVAVLERVGAASTDPERLVLILVPARRAPWRRRPHSRGQCLGDARSRVASRAGARDAWLEDEAAVAQAQALRLSGSETEAEALAARSLVRLRAASVVEPCARVREAFASAAILGGRARTGFRLLGVGGV